MNLRDECNQLESSIAQLGALTWNVLSPYVLVFDCGTASKFCDVDLKVRLGL
jgi:hypothetical protein